MKIPFLDLELQYNSLKSEIDKAIQEVLDNTAFIGGKAFEKPFADFQGARFCISVSSGTAALHLALWALGVRAGDEVIIPANTFIATAEAVSLLGANPVLVDCDANFNINTSQIAAKITDKTAAIIPVHLYGLPCNMDVIMKIAWDKRIKVIEDACQAQGCENIGLGDAAAFSFYPSKTLGAYGDAGAVLTNSPQLASQIRLLQNHGRSSHNEHIVPGHNYKMNAIQAAILRVKLKHLPTWIERKRQIATQYIEGLAEIPEVTPPAFHLNHTWTYFVIRVERRGELKNYLTDQGIATGIHYPKAIHQHEAYYSVGKFPMAEKAATEILSLPIYPEMTEEQVRYVINHIWTFYRI